jgi:hypothetical protein
VRWGSFVHAPDMGDNGNDGEWVWNFYAPVNPPGIDSGDTHHFSSEEERDFLDQAGHLRPVGDFYPALAGRLWKRLGVIFLAKPPGGSVEAIANAVLRLQIVKGRRRKGDPPFNASGFKPLAHLFPEGVPGYRSHETIPSMIEALDGADDIFFISGPVDFPNPDPPSQLFLGQQFGLERQEGLIEFS